MKILFSLFIMLFAAQVSANCKTNQVRAWNKDSGYSCVQRFQNTTVTDCVLCQGQTGKKQSFDKLFADFPSAIYQSKPLPWWAQQGNLHYPNLHYPGAWSNKKKNPGINAKYYPGEGEVHALKPNIYIESIHQEKKFNFSFTSQEPLSFLATTPPLDEKNTWKGKIVKNDRFEVDDIHYDYLFYDIRLPKEKMQFERGLCATREDAIKWMLKDLTAMKYPAIALQDFEEHWNVKIPDFPYYCIYPQYNKQLDAVLPVSISLEQSNLTRSLYVLIPHKKEPDAEELQEIPLPLLDSEEFRPIVFIKYENMFKEWGVAFLGE
jgi:hypothetical protein